VTAAVGVQAGLPSVLCDVISAVEEFMVRIEWACRPACLPCCDIMYSIQQCG
jgi:hypothetical protein